MSKYLFFIIFLLVSCSKNESNHKEQVNEKIAYTMESLTYEISSNTLEVESIELISEEGKYIEQVIIVKNNSRISIEVSNIVLNNSNLEIINDSCSNQTILRKRYCTFSLKNITTEIGNYIGEITINENTLLANLTINSNSSSNNTILKILPENEINFGMVESNQKSSKILSITNTHRRESVDVDVDFLENNGFKIIENNCPSSLPRLKTCFLNIEYSSPLIIENNSLVNDKITISGQEILLKAELISDQLEDSSCSLVNNDLEIHNYTLNNTNTELDFLLRDEYILKLKNKSRTSIELC